MWEAVYLLELRVARSECEPCVTCGDRFAMVAEREASLRELNEPIDLAAALAKAQEPIDPQVFKPGAGGHDQAGGAEEGGEAKEKEKRVSLVDPAGSDAYARAKARFSESESSPKSKEPSVVLTPMKDKGDKKKAAKGDKEGDKQPLLDAKQNAAEISC